MRVVQYLIQVNLNLDIVQQERLYAEIMSVVGTEDTDVTIQDLRAMTYLEQVIKETLRKFFLVSSVTRKVSEDLKISELVMN